MVALLSACCLFLTTLEYLIPKPFPFLKIGLANLPVLLALLLLPPLPYLLLLCMKTGIQTLVSGNLFSYVALFSAGGTFSSGLVMLLFYRFGRHFISFIGVSVAGALASSVTQLLLAGVYPFGDAVRLIAPPFLAFAVASGLLIGLFTEAFARQSTWIAGLQRKCDHKGTEAG